MIWTERNVACTELPPHRHDMHELFVSLNDQGTQYIEGQSCTFQRGRGFMLYSGCVHHISVSPNSRAEFAFVCFDRNHLAEAGFPGVQEQLEASRKRLCFFSGIDSTYRNFNVDMILKLHSEVSGSGALNSEYANAVLVQLLIEFFRSADSASGPNVGLNQKREKVIKLCKRVALDSSLDLSLEAAAHSAGHSRSSFAAAIRDVTGLTWRQYILDCRLKKSVNLLATHAMQISEVAFACSFTNIGYFHRAFQKKFGMSPGAMRRVLQQNRFPHLLNLDANLKP